MDVRKMLTTLGAMAITVAAVAATPAPVENVKIDSSDAAIVQAQQKDGLLLYSMNKGADATDVNWHSSHSSHVSHASHVSHSSHSSHSSGYRW